MTIEIGPAPADRKVGRRTLRRMFGPLIFAVQPIVMNVISIPVTAYIIRRLGPEDWGQWSTALGLIQIVSVLTSMGIRGHYVRTVAHEPAMAARLTAEQFGLRFLLAVMAGTLALFIATAIMHYPPVVIICTALAATGLVISCVATTGIDLFQASQRLTVIAAIGMAQGTTLTLASALAVWAGAGPIGLGVAYLTGPIVWLTISMAVIHTSYFPVRFHWNLRRFWVHLKAARYLAAQQIIASIGRNAEALMAPRMIGMTRYGLFAAGTMVSDRMTAIPDGLGSALYPIVSATHSQNPQQSTIEVASFLSLTLALCVPICIMSMFLAVPIAQILFPTDPQLCTTVIQITVWALPLVGTDFIMMFALNAAGRETSQARIVLLSNILTLATSTVLIFRFGLIGACVSWVVRHPVSIVLRLPNFLKTFRGAFAELPLLRIAACNALLIAVLWWGHPLLWASTAVASGRTSLYFWIDILGRMAVEGTVAMVVYGVSATLLRVFGDAELGALIGRIRRRRS